MGTAGDRMKVFGGVLRIDEVVERNPDRGGNFPRIGPDQGVVGDGEDEGGDCNLRSAAGGPDVVKAADQMGSRPKVDADFFGRLTDGRVDVLLTRVAPSAGKGHVTRPGVVLVVWPLDQQDVEVFVTRAKEKGDGGAAGRFVDRDQAGPVGRECRFEAVDAYGRQRREAKVPRTGDAWPEARLPGPDRQLIKSMPGRQL